MSQKFHYNSNGLVSVCRARLRVCPLGLENHFDTFDEALRSFENEMKKELLAVLQKRPNLEKEREKELEDFTSLIETDPSEMKPEQFGAFIRGYEAFNPDLNDKSIPFIHKYLYKYGMTTDGLYADFIPYMSFIKNEETLKENLGKFFKDHKDQFQHGIMIEISSEYNGGTQLHPNLSIVVKKDEPDHYYIQKFNILGLKETKFNSVDDLVTSVKSNEKFMNMIYKSESIRRYNWLTKIKSLNKPLNFL